MFMVHILPAILCCALTELYISSTLISMVRYDYPGFETSSRKAK